MIKTFLRRLVARGSTLHPPLSTEVEPLRVPCRADLWCRKRTSLSSMLDPDLFELYMTGDDRIDEDWVIQSNPPCAFKAEFPATEASAGPPGRSDGKEGCDALLALLQLDPGLHATKGWLNFTPPGDRLLSPSDRAAYVADMQTIVRTAERELKDRGG